MFGLLTGALPNGRKAGETLSNGISPSDGRDVSGITSMLQSAARMDNLTAANGVALNVKFSPTVFHGDGAKAVADLFRTYFDLGGMHVQVNVLDREALIDAKQNPEGYRNLLVRIRAPPARGTP